MLCINVRGVREFYMYTLYVCLFYAIPREAYNPSFQVSTASFSVFMYFLKPRVIFVCTADMTVVLPNSNKKEEQYIRFFPAILQ